MAGSKAASARRSWREVEARIRKAIERQELDVGAQLPTEGELMRNYAASRYAIRRALGSLQQDGLVRIEQGRGTFVHENYLVSYRLGDRPRFTNVLLEDQLTPANEVVRIAEMPASPLVAQSLGIPQDAPVLFMENLGYANGQVVKQDSNYFPLPRFQALAALLRTKGSVTEALVAFGIADYRRQRTSIAGRLPTAAEARVLRQLPTTPVFEILRVDIDEQDASILFGITIFSCERVRLVLERDGKPRD